MRFVLTRAHPRRNIGHSHLWYECKESNNPVLMDDHGPNVRPPRVRSNIRLLVLCSEQFFVLRG